VDAGAAANGDTGGMARAGATKPAMGATAGGAVGNEAVGNEAGAAGRGTASAALDLGDCVSNAGTENAATGVGVNVG
jgi:hypothetical protein